MLDPTDIEILKILNRNCRIKLNHLAKEVHLTPPAVAARVERLEATGVIRKYTIEANLAEMGFQRQVFIQAGLKANQKKAYLALIKRYRNTIRHHYRTTGEMNALIEAAFFTAADLDDFLQQLSVVATYRVIDVVAEAF
jgi:Lrp/AsnC family leucine-responsive transcriptional regulator